MEIYKKNLWIFLFGSILFIGLGLGFLIKTDAFMKIVCYIIGIAAIIAGVYKILSFLITRKHSIKSVLDPIVGAFSVIAGIILLFNPRFITDFFTVITGVAIILGSAFKLWNAFELKNSFAKLWWLLFFVSLSGLVIGFILVLEPDKASTAVFRLVGAAFLIDGVDTLFTLIYSYFIIKKFTPIKTTYKEIVGDNDSENK